MPQSTGSDLHIDRLLSQMAIGYFQESNIAGLIAPIVNVEKESDLFSIFSRADALRTEDSRRARGDEANKITRTVSSDSYRCQNYALKYPIFLEDRVNADPVYVQELVNNAAKYVTDKLALDWEVRVAGIVNSTSNVGSSSGVASEWDGAATSNPIGNIMTAMDNSQDLTGKRPNRLVMGLAAWNSLRRNNQILDRIHGTTNAQGFATRDQVAGLLEVDQILVGAAYRNTNAEGLAESLSKVWRDNVTAYYVPNAPSRDEPSFMYSFRWAAPGLPNMQAERHPYDSKKKVEEVEVGYYQVEKVTGAQYAFTLISVNSST